MSNRRKQLYSVVTNVNDIPQQVYHDVVAAFEYAVEHNFICDAQINEEQFLVDIYNAKYAGKEIK